VALKLDLWKNAPSPDLTQPFHRAEARYVAGDFPNALTALDQLAVRFAEPRWPTMPTPFRELRVAIPAPMPPSWDPDNALAPADRDAKRLRHFAELQLALARASLDWAQSHGIAVDDLRSPLEAAGAAFVSDGPGESFWSPLDGVWASIRERVPPPAGPSPTAVAPPPETEAGADPA
jgi:hypothetical protein